ncbi:MAG TPA: gamma-type small acid-soluble spore protein [Bacillales bacterium]|nr:gamma-type small acid-soluble spore protein [Bacillales bacterium]
MKNNQDAYTVVGTNINEVKSQNENSGMSYNQVKEWLAKTSGGCGTEIYSNTDGKNVKNSIQTPEE